MNLILGTLAELKAHLLNEALREPTTYDGAIAALGRGVAARFESQCNRRFGRVVADAFVTSADRRHLVLPRYPVEAVTKLELRETLAGGWVDQGDIDDCVDIWDPTSGIVHLPAPLSQARGAQLRVTFTGGFWFDESADGTPTGSRTWQQGSEALAEGAESLAVEFDQAFASAPNVSLRIVPPSGGMIINVVPSAITTAGFTALIGFPIPASGYALQWEATSSAADATPEAGQPEGSTARPQDLYLAWLLQCEHVWARRDALGVNLAADKSGTSPELTGLSRLELIPEAMETLRLYVRYAS
jgi:hypothetical protein